jgi:cytochrome c peroxidase
MRRSWLLVLLCVATGVGARAEPGASDPVTPIEPPSRVDSTNDSAKDRAKIELGRKLFGDKRLSHDNVLACASCHRLEAAGDDGHAHSQGADGRPLEFNTPTIFNAANNYRLNWRGNFRTLEEHNESTLLNRRIMNTSWQELLAKLGGDRDYASAFIALYGRDPEPPAVLGALAAFQRSLLTPNSRFDRRLRGERDAISAEEEQGFQLFKSYGCIACHQGMNFGGNLFQRFGVFADPFTPIGGNEADLGRFAITGIEEDRQVFRVPSLRNVAVTAPYFHNGYTSSLTEAVEIMARSQLGRELPREDLARIVQFLNTLTGEYRGRSLAGRDR